MKRIKLLIAIFPSIIMHILSVLIFSSMFNLGNLGLHNMAFISLAVIIPLLFLIQGGLCGWTDTNVYMSFIFSTIGFLYIAIIYFDKYSLIALICYIFIGYCAYLIISSLKRRIDLKYYRNIRK